MPLGPIELNTNLNTIPAATPTTPLPSNGYDVSTDVYQMPFSQHIWRPSDDKREYNFHIRDDPTDTDGAYIGGRGTVGKRFIGELCGFLNIPNGWKATKIYVDLRGGGYPLYGAALTSSLAIYMYEVKTVTADTTIDPDYAHVSLGNTTTNTEYTLSTEMVGKIDNAMWIRFLNQVDTYHFIGGGYITLERV